MMMMMDIGLDYSCGYNVTDGEKQLAYFSEDSVTEYELHIFEYCVIPKTFPIVIEERDFTSGFFSPW